MPPIALSWALAQTVDGALRISRDAAIAASDDNVQAITLLACERFGATLAISTLTRRKIESMIRKQAAGPIQKFLQAKIGYAKGGSIDALSKSAEGIRFLSLASALVSSCNNFDAATALEKMVEDTAEDKKLSPTAYQLKDLPDVLEPRLNRAGFLDEVGGFQTQFFHATNQAVADNMVIPSPEAIHELVKGFRELSRIGNADTQSLKITVGPFAAWVSTFARWSVEVPPRILFQSEDMVITDQPESKVTICISKDARYEKKIEIETIYTYQSTHKLVNAIIEGEDKPALATGMVSLETHGSLTLRDFGFGDGLGFRACKQALPFALHLVRSTFDRTHDSSQFEFQKTTPKMKSLLQFLSPFPNDEVIAAIMNRYLQQSKKTSLQSLEGDFQIGQIPLVRLWIEQKKDNDAVEKDPLEPEAEFCAKLSHIVTDILSLSLLLGDEVFSSKEAILLHYVPNRQLPSRYQNDNSWQDLAKRILRSSIEPYIGAGFPDIKLAIGWALRLVGHDVGNIIDTEHWVASSFRGQVVLPSILLADEIPSNGFACLSYFHGILMLETQKNRHFSRILSKSWSFVESKFDTARKITAHSNAFPGESIKWELSSKAEHLELSMRSTFDKHNQRPLRILSTLMQSVMMAPCWHAGDAELSVQVRRLVIFPPGCDPIFETDKRTSTHILVCPLFGNEGLKLLALASLPTKWYMDLGGDLGTRNNPTTLINRGACINCVLNACFVIECYCAIL